MNIYFIVQHKPKGVGEYVVATKLARLPILTTQDK